MLSFNGHLSLQNHAGTVTVDADDQRLRLTVAKPQQLFQLLPWLLSLRRHTATMVADGHYQIGIYLGDAAPLRFATHGVKPRFTTVRTGAPLFWATQLAKGWWRTR
ncbi:hypothetical protein [Ferrimonas senticii]|uniref:hypothetical protein n=1 Tax=Ferrimonas senticii TaxID=394566 RepID=UPI000400251D|nr:hypothetical protein [Ferrimonas senticii]